MADSATDLRGQRRADNARKLIKLARQHTTESGLNGFTVELLCQEAAVSRRTFFNYFASKDDAVLGIPLHRDSDEAIFAFLAGATPARTGLSETLLADLVMFWSARWATFDIEPQTVAELSAAVQREPRLLTRLWEHLTAQQVEDVDLVCKRERLPPGDLRAAAAVQVVEAISRAATLEYLSEGNREPFLHISRRRVWAAHELFATQTAPIGASS